MNYGKLALSAVAVQNNLVFTSTIKGGALGGGIFNNGTLSIGASTLSGNTASGLG